MGGQKSSNSINGWSHSVQQGLSSLRDTQILADQLTLSQPRGEIILDPRIFRPSYNPARPVVLGVTGGAMASPDFGRSVNPVSTRVGANYAHQIILAPLDFQTFLRPALLSNVKVNFRGSSFFHWHKHFSYKNRGTHVRLIPLKNCKKV